MHRLSAGRVKGEHIGVLGQPHTTGLRPLGAATVVLIKQLNTVRGERQPAGGMGLGVLFHQPARSLKEVAQDQELGRLQVNMRPPQRAQLSPPSTRRRGQPQQDREIRISLVGGLKEPGDLLWGGRADLGRPKSGWAGEGSWVGRNPAPAGRLIQPPAQDRVNLAQWPAPSVCLRRRRGRATPS
jgi:hypothetical protein